MTIQQIQAVKASYKVYRNTGSVSKGRWVFQPHDFDSSFELYSPGYATRREALEAAYRDLAEVFGGTYAGMTPAQVLSARDSYRRIVGE